MKKNQVGFTAVEGLLILVIIGIIGFVGWFVWNAKHNTDINLNNANKSSAVVTKAQTKKTVDSIESCTTKDEAIGNIQTVTSATGRFTVKIPGGWNINDWISQDYLYAGGLNDIKYSSSAKPTIASGDTNPVEGGATRRFSMQAVDIKDKEKIGSGEGTACTLPGNNGSEIKRYMTDITPEMDPQSGVQYTSYVYYIESSNNAFRASYSVVKGEADQVTMIDTVVKSVQVK